MVVKAPPRYQVCPRCRYGEEQGKRWDRRRQVYKFFWHNEQCPQCGSALLRQCPSCGGDIHDPARTACPHCGTAYPWSA